MQCEFAAFDKGTLSDVPGVWITRCWKRGSTVGCGVEEVLLLDGDFASVESTFFLLMVEDVLAAPASTSPGWLCFYNSVFRDLDPRTPWVLTRLTSHLKPLF